MAAPPNATLAQTGASDSADVGPPRLRQMDPCSAVILTPAGAVSPIASWLEYPDGPGRDPAEINDEAGISLLPVGDVRNDLLDAIDTATPEQLRTAWQAAAAMREWALAQCAAVEAELDSGELGDATTDWMMGAALGLPRLLVRDVLRDRRPSTSTRVSTAIMLLFIADGLRRLRELVPDGQFELLPRILPPFLYELAGVRALEPPA